MHTIFCEFKAWFSYVADHRRAIVGDSWPRKFTKDFMHRQLWTSGVADDCNLWELGLTLILICHRWSAMHFWTKDFTHQWSKGRGVLYTVTGPSVVTFTRDYNSSRVCCAAMRALKILWPTVPYCHQLWDMTNNLVAIRHFMWINKIIYRQDFIGYLWRVWFLSFANNGHRIFISLPCCLVLAGSKNCLPLCFCKTPFKRTPERGRQSPPTL